ncbi:MAG: hypothetical protein HY426_03340 [Candidatus Levybacteria bacterium]|nr:hypothetical protein [Candidatus Levybacteria bacterium]
MAETNLAFSKVVATPTPTAWSQAYSAGRLFAAISLQSDITPSGGEENLNSIGKDLISTMESEFFTLETKDLDSIKLALETTIGRIREGIKISLVVCFLNDNVLYLFATGGAKAVLKRGDKIGTVLQADDNESAVKSASGYVQEKDIIILQTKSFLRLIQPSTLASSLDHNDPEEIAENLAPFVHEKAEGGASAIILLYKESVAADISEENKIEESETLDEGVIPVVDIDDKTPDLKEESEGEEAKAETEELAKPAQDYKPAATESTETPSPFLTDRPPRRKSLSFGFGLGFLRKSSGLSHQRKIILTIAIILLALILITGVLAIKNRGSSSAQQAFASVIAKAQEKYDEGQNLKDLNAPLAQESFRSAKKILDDNKTKFKENSNEGKQLLALLAKVESEIKSVSEGEIVAAKEVEKSQSDLLSYELDNSDASYFTQNEDFVYFLDGKGVSRIDKGNDEKEQIIKKDWKQESGIGLFGSNVYVLGKDVGILKFVAASESAYSKTDYFPESPDLGNSIAMAIDGSIYVLFDDGTIKKYTKGKEESFAVSGLDKPLSKPTRIFTNEDADNVYVLDSGNGRIVVFDKEGKFSSAYSASILKSAKDFDVQETNKKIFILSSGKVYQINIK